MTAINGGTAFAAADETRHDVRSWLSTSISELSVAPGETIRVPFTLLVPPSASPGDHVAGWVVEGPPKAPQSGGVGATVLERVGVAVVVQVTGSTVEDLVLGTVCLNQETGSNYFQVTVGNAGNVLTKGEGTLRLTTKDGQELFTRPVELGAVLPGDSTFFRADIPLDPGPGSYVVSIAMRTTGGQAVQTSADIDIGQEKVNGCRAVAGSEQGPSARPEGGGVAQALPGGGLPWLTILLIALVVLLSALLAGRELRGRRRRARPE